MVVLLLQPVYVLLVLLEHARAVLTAGAVVLGQPPVLGPQAAVLGLAGGHLVAHVVQVMLELLLHVSGQAGAVELDPVQVLPLLLTGEMEGHVRGEEGVDLVEEGIGDVGDAAQGLHKFSFTPLLTKLRFLFMLSLIPPQTDGLQVQVVSVFGDLVHFPLQLLGRLGAVGF